MKKETRDQLAHFGSNWALNMVGGVPIFGPIFLTWWWAATREYYQWKIKARSLSGISPDFMLIVKNMKLWKLDMHWSNGGNLFAALCWSGIYWYLIASGRIFSA